MTSTTTSGTTLVVGATGKTGRRVVDRLKALGEPVRAASRNGDPHFDWDDRSTWAPALRGVRAAYISYYPDLAVPGATETVAAFAEHAVAAGVQRIVLLSGRGVAEAQRAEQAVQAAGAETTIVRCSWFDQNFSEGHFLEPLLDGELALPVDGVREPLGDLDDLPHDAVAALTEDGHAGQVYELTGPRLLTFAEALGEIAAASGRELAFVPITLEQYAAAMVAAGLPEDVVWLTTYLFEKVLDGRNECLTDGVRRALGREPRDFADYARRAAATGVWGSGR
jgi:uncharacterized protein YbjT (DUF2867 family)